jgi:hypothetical protein
VSTQPTRHTGPPVHQTTFDPTAPEALVTAIVDALSTVTETPRLELSPLYGTLNLETTARLVRHAAARESVVELEFAVDSWIVSLTSEGTVAVYSFAERGEPDGPINEADR